MASVIGPNYETPAEVALLGIIGADVVGMSMAPELCESCELGIKCIGVSIVTNRAGARSNHDEVLSAASTASKNLVVIVEKFLEKLIQTDL